MVAGIGALGRFISRADDLIDAAERPAKDLLRWAAGNDFNPIDMPRTPTFGLRNLNPRPAEPGPGGIFQSGERQTDWETSADAVEEWFNRLYVYDGSYRDPIDDSPVLNFSAMQEVLDPKDIPEDYVGPITAPNARKVPDFALVFDDYYGMALDEHIREFERLPGISPWADQIGDEIAQTGETLSGISRQIVMGHRGVDNPITAMAHWQHVGNENVQSLLRTGRLDLPLLGDNVRELIERGYDYEDVDDIFRTSANATIGWLDDLIDASRMHPNVSIYRGLSLESVQNAFGFDFVHNMGLVRQSIWNDNPDIVNLGRGFSDARGQIIRPRFSSSAESALERLNSYVGNEFVDFAYTSGSLDPGVAARFIDGGGGYVIQIDVPKRHGLLSITGNLRKGTPAYLNEHEMILARNTKFQVVSVVPTYYTSLKNADVFGLARTAMPTILGIIKLRVV
jgi:hypothetical protein